MSANAFTPSGDTALIAVTSTASTGVQVKGNIANATSRMIQNLGTKVAYLAWGATDTPAVVPVAGTPHNGIPIQAGVVLILSFPPNAYFSAICAGSDSTSLTITPGEGN